MTQRILQWLNANAQRRYPFVDDADPGVADNVILDFAGTVTDDAYDGTGITLVSVVVYPGVAGLLFQFVCSGVPFSVEVPGNASFPYKVAGATDGLRYAVVFGEGCVNLFAAEGAIRPCQGQLLPATIAVSTRQRVNSITADGYAQTLLDGQVFIAPGHNCDPVVSPTKIKLVAGVGYGTGEDCVPEANGVISCGNALLRLNGQAASEDGNINIKVVGAEMVADPETHTITIRAGAAVKNVEC